MKILTKLFVAFFLLVFASRIYAKEQIVIETDNTSLVFTIGDNGRLYQSYLGKNLQIRQNIRSCRLVMKRILLTVWRIALNRLFKSRVLMEIRRHFLNIRDLRQNLLMEVQRL